MLPAADMRPLEDADIILSEEADRILQTESHLSVLIQRFGNNSIVVKSLYIHQFNSMVGKLEELTRSSKAKSRRLSMESTTSEMKYEGTEEENLVRALQRWVHAHSNVMDTSMNPDNETWRDVALYADPIRREQGMRWITESMYRKTDAMFQSHGLNRHDIADNFCDFQILFENNSYNVIQVRQAELDVPFETVIDMHQTHLGSTFMLDYFHPSGFETLQEMTGNLSLHRLVTNKDVCMHLLSGVFHEKDRSIIVVRQIEDDEKHNNRDYCQRSRMTWLDVRRIPRRKKTKMRTFTILSQSFTRSSFVPLEDEAARWGIDLSRVPMHLREEVFAREGCTRFNNKVDLRKRQFLDLAEYAKQTKIRPFSR